MIVSKTESESKFLLALFSLLAEWQPKLLTVSGSVGGGSDRQSDLRAESCVAESCASFEFVDDDHIGHVDEQDEIDQAQVGVAPPTHPPPPLPAAEATPK